MFGTLWKEDNMNLKPVGEVELIIEHKDGTKEVREICNVVLSDGKEALSRSLANSFGDSYDFYIDRMLFGTFGTVSGVPKVVEDSRNGLFGPTLLSKNVISSLDVIPTKAIFTSVVSFDDGVGSAINEMALQMKTGDLYSMVTFGDISKTSSMQITFNWSVSFL